MNFTKISSIDFTKIQFPTFNKQVKNQTVENKKVKNKKTSQNKVLSNNSDFNRSSHYINDIGAKDYHRSSSFVLSLLDNKSFSRSSVYTIDLSKPWWMKVPYIAIIFCKIFLSPIFLIKYLIDFSLSFILLGIFSSLILWYIGFIPEDAVVGFFTNIGDRGLSILEKLGVPF